MLVTLVLALAPQFALDGFILDPYQVTDPVGGATLVVDPDNRDGTGGADYTLLRDGEVIWKRHEPFALSKVKFGPAGEIAGYTHAGSFVESIVVATLSTASEAFTVDRIERGWPPYSDSQMTPVVVGIESLPNSGVFLLRLDHRMEPAEVWRAYSWATGEPVAFGPADECSELGWVRRIAERVEPNVSASRREDIEEVEILHGPELVLERWVVRHLGDKETPPQAQTHDALIDAAGHVVWQRDAAYVARGFDWSAIQGDHVQVAPDGWSFAIDTAGETDKELDAYRIAPDASAATGWTVTKVTPAELAWLTAPLSEPEAELNPDASHLRTLELERIDAHKLDVPVTGTRIRDWTGSRRNTWLDRLLAWQVLPNGEILIVEHDDAGAFRCRRLDADFKEIAVVAIDAALKVDAQACTEYKHVTQWFPIDTGRWFVSESEHGLKTKTIVRESIVDGRTGKVQALDLRKTIGAPSTDWWAPIVNQAQLFPDGGLLLNVDRGGSPYSSDLLVAYDAKLKLDWMVEEAKEYGQKPHWSHVAIAADGAVIGAGVGILQGFPIWNRKGRLRETFEWSEHPDVRTADFTFDSPGQVIPWFDGKVLFTDKGDTSIAYAFDPESTRLRRLQLGGDSPIGQWLIGGLNVLPASGAWTHRRHVFLRLDKDGVVVEARAPTRADIVEPSASLVTSSGQVLIYDGPQGRLHVWDPLTAEETLVDVEWPDTATFESVYTLTELADGRVMMEGDTAFRKSAQLFWTPGAWTATRRDIVDTRFWTPDGRFEWTFGMEDQIRIHDKDGAVVRTIERHAGGDGQADDPVVGAAYLRDLSGIAFDADGTVWIEEHGWSFGSDNDEHAHHAIQFTPNGEELACLPVDRIHFPQNGALLDERPAALRVGDEWRFYPSGPKHQASARFQDDLPQGVGRIPNTAPNELWIFEADSLTLHRYKLPAELLGD